MKQNTSSGESGAPYIFPTTRIISIRINANLLYNSGDYGKAGGDPAEDDETVLL